MSRNIIRIKFPDGEKWRELPFYLAAEEYAARNLPPDHSYFFCWRVKPTVICGRNQLIDSEINLPYCRLNHIDVVRRRSGGGCVYADPDNVMLSYITATGNDISQTFAGYTEMITKVLRKAGFRAEASSRNDIHIDGKKVSGGAYYRLGSRSIAHSTMLIKIDSATMEKALTPSEAKLRSKGVESVRSRVTCLSNYLPDFTAEKFMELAGQFTSGNSITLTPEEIEEIEKTAAGYRLSSWVEGNNPKVMSSTRRHIDGVGEIAVDVNLDYSFNPPVIKSISFAGDFFTGTLPVESITEMLRNKEFTPQAVEEALGDKDLNGIITGLTPQILMSLLF